MAQDDNLELFDVNGERINLRATWVGGAHTPHALIDFDPSSANLDAFARLRVSNPTTIFDSKQIHNNAPLFFDDQEISGSLTTSVWSQDTASTVLGVALNTAGRRVRQTFMRFNYQPGKSQLVYMTGTLGADGGGAGITRCMGIYDDDNGIFMQDDEGVVKVCIRSSTSGSAVDTKIAQADWNIDPFDGSGPSGFTLNPSASQLIVIDYEWLSVGRVRIGFLIGGMVCYVHQFLHANVSAGAYMSTPNLPIRYEIENDGTGVASTLEHICATVISEGGQTELGVNHSETTEAEYVNANTAGARYAVYGIRLKAANLDSVVKIIGISMLMATTDDYHWELIINPTVAGSPTWSDHADSTIQEAKGDTSGNPSATTITGGHVLDSGYVKSGAAAGGTSESVDTQLRLGSAIDGTPDEIWLTVMPLSSNADVYGGLGWKEIS